MVGFDRIDGRLAAGSSFGDLRPVSLRSEGLALSSGKCKQQVVKRMSHQNVVMRNGSEGMRRSDSDMFYLNFGRLIAPYGNKALLLKVGKDVPHDFEIELRHDVCLLG